MEDYQLNDREVEIIRKALLGLHQTVPVDPRCYPMIIELINKLSASKPSTAPAKEAP